MPAAVKLYLFVITGFFRKIRHDLARELTVLAASLVVLAVTAYVFNDFLNEQVAAVSPAMRAAFAGALAPVVLLTAVATALVWVAGFLRDPASPVALAEGLGETSGSCRFAAVASALTIVAAVQLPAWWLVYRYLTAPPLPIAAAAAGVMVLVSLGGGFWRGAMTPARGAAGRAAAGPALGETSAAPPPGPGALIRAMSRWRLLQMLWRYGAARAAIAAAALPAALAAAATARGLPPFVAGVCGLAAGMFVVLACAFQLAEDLRHPFTERLAGVTHADYLKSWERTSWLLGLAAALLVGLAVAVAGVTAGRLAGGALVDAALRAAVLALVMPGIFPWLMLQIDGRRPAVVLMPVLLIGAFIGTALLAHWLSLLLLPLLRYYAVRSQEGRFYRA